MLRKFLIIGLILLSAGTVTLVLLRRYEVKWQRFQAECRSKYAEPIGDYIRQYTEWLKLPQHLRTTPPWENNADDNPTPETIKQKQYERFVADIEKLDTLELHFYPMAQLLYGDDWQKRLKDYKTKRELEKAGFAAAIISCCIGGALVATASAAAGIKRLKKTEPSNLIQLDTKDPNTRQKPEQNPRRDANKVPDKNKKDLASILNCHNYSTAEPIEDENKKPEEKKEAADKPAEIKQQPAANLHAGSGKPAAKKTDDKNNDGPDRTLKTKTQPNNSRPAYKENYRSDSFFSSYRKIQKKAGEIDRGLKEVAGRSDTANAVKQPKVLHDTLSKLTEEVAAIRHYAGQQQEKVKKLQEGYDWNIIRNFALRIIRCLDNLEMRIAAAEQNDGDTAELEEIRDELIFALESSGLQRYEPQIKSEYRGQEKTAEAIKDKKSTDEPALRGKIAEIVRCGYRYFIDDTNYKVVRAAQVRLFG